MTTANKVTIFRTLLIPFFVVEVLYYVREGNDLHRWLAVGIFLFASVCDGVDGYITIGKPVIRPRWVGKTATVLQMAAVLWVLLRLSDQGFLWLAIAGALCTGVSGVLYILDGVRQLSAHPTSSAKSGGNQ